ncbi:MAG TPA: hypothetical protein HA319_05600 [Nitrosopumilaceae archaeon]|jgi:hypothetical protein|nr:hypothetical protein [Nitrosopumilaceae archaeon]
MNPKKRLGIKNIMKRRSKISIIIISIIAVLAIFGYLQYAAATQLHVSMKSSKIIERTDDGTLYTINLEFENSSFMILNVGRTDFIISAEEENLGAGILEPTIIPANGKSIVETPFLADNKILDKYEQKENSPSLRLDGSIAYNLLFTTLKIPFTYYPTQEEAREFIHGQ